MKFMGRENMDTKPINLGIDDFMNPVGFCVSYLNVTPHKKQQEVLLHPAKNKVIVSGRRSGKTELIAMEWIRGAVLKIYLSQILIAPTFKQVLIIFDKIVEMVTCAGVYNDILKITHSPYPKIEWKNGAFIDFASADNPNSIRGFAYGRVGKDESAFIKRGADNAIKPLTYDLGAPVWEFTSPWGKGDVWEKWQRCKKGDDKDWAYFHYNYKDNPYLSKEGIKEIEKDIVEYGEDSVYVQCEIYGNFVEDRDAYFKQEEIDNCIEEYNLPEEPRARCNYYLGNDIAGEGEDESVCISVWGHSEGIRVVSIDNFLKNKPREIVGLDIQLYQKYKYLKMCLDKTGLGEGPEDWVKEELENIGVNGDIVEGIRFTVQSKMDMYSNLKKLMNQGKLKFPPHKKLIFQLLDLRREITSSGNLKLHHSEKGHDDYPDALALACWASKEVDEEWTPTIA